MARSGPAREEEMLASANPDGIPRDRRSHQRPTHCSLSPRHAPDLFRHQADRCDSEAGPVRIHPLDRFQAPPLARAQPCPEPHQASRVGVTEPLRGQHLEVVEGQCELAAIDGVEVRDHHEIWLETIETGRKPAPADRDEKGPPAGGGAGAPLPIFKTPRRSPSPVYENTKRSLKTTALLCSSSVCSMAPSSRNHVKQRSETWIACSRLMRLRMSVTGGPLSAARKPPQVLRVGSFRMSDPPRLEERAGNPVESDPGVVSAPVGKLRSPPGLSCHV